ncbi:MAG: signal peptide peptidase SppA [Bacteroidales bacterium]
MKEFLKFTLAAIVGLILFSVLAVIFLLSTVSALVVSGEKPVSITENSVLVLKAGIPIPDRGNPFPFAGFDLTDLKLSPAPGLNDILTNLRKAAKDEKIKGVLIENGLSAPGWATTEEIRDALSDFRKSGKFVIAYSDYVLLQEGYYLSTAADRIYIDPASSLDFKGLSGDVMFYKDALEKLGVVVQVTRVGKFKGAVEPFILNGLSKDNEEQIRIYTMSIWNHALDNISKSRSIPVERLNMIADSLIGTIASDALREGMVDGLLYRNDLIDTLKSLSGIKQDDKLYMVSMARYSRVPEPQKMVSAKNKIAVIYASGTIVMGKGNANNIGGNAFSDLIRKERKDSLVKAIVLRVNSPGGNAVASDIMWKELELAAKVKPVVISMGNYAASGGYYISAPGTKIFASPTTITGSIGVFGMIPDFEGLMTKKLGITNQTVNTNKYSDFPSVFRPMGTYEKVVMQSGIDKMYGEFVSKVAHGRKMRAPAVDSIAQGRVWTGVDAKGIGLIDEFGGLKASVEAAASLAGIETYSIRELPALEDPYTRLMSQFSGDARARLIRNELGEYSRYFDELQEIREITGIQARLPYFIEIH